MNITIATNALLPADKEGGPAYSNFYLAQALLKAGAAVCVVTTDRNGPDRLDVPVDRWIERDGAPVFYASTRAGAWIRSPSYAEAIDGAVAKSDVCIMSGVFWNHTGFAAARACWRGSVPYITMPRGLLSPWALNHKGLKKRLYWNLLARRIVDHSAALVALAEQEERDIISTGIRRPVHVIPNGAFVDGLDLAGGAPAAPSTLSLPSSVKRYVLFLGRIHPKKGLDVLIPAFDRVAARFEDVALVIAGTSDADYQEQFDALLKKAATRERIHLVGNVSGAAKAALLRGASVFALTSYSEGLPVAVLEALAAGQPVVLTPGCNLPEVSAKGAGLEVRLDAEAVALALMRVLDDSSLRQSLAANALRLARESFSWDAVARRMLNLCQTIAPSPSRTVPA